MKIKKLWKIFLCLFFINLLIFNWNKISWFFNYQAVSDLTSDFLKKESLAVQNKEIQNIDIYEATIEIPKIEISVPLIFPTTSKQTELVKSLDLGAVHFPNSVMPGQIGQTIILGHSSPVNWPKTKYKWIFSQLNELIEGDKIYIFLNDRKYQYFVVRKFFLEKGERISSSLLTKNNNMLYLVSCWPPGKTEKRIVVEAETQGRIKIK